MDLVPLAPTDAMFNLATHKVIITASDVAALGAGTTGTLAIYPRTGTFPAGYTARFAGLELITAFDASDAAINSLLIEVGDGGDTDRLLVQTEIAVDGTEILFRTSAANTQPYAYLVADTIDALFTVAGGASPTLAEINAGEVHLYLHISPPRMTRIKGPL